MSVLRNAAVVLLVILLAVDIAAANALVAVDRTVLDPDFVTTSLEESGAYEQAEVVVLDQLPEEGLSGNDSPPVPIDLETVVSAAVDAEYLQSQLEPNLERAYAYLHGNADELELTIDLEPPKAAIVAAVEAELTDATAVELLRTVGGGSGAPTLDAAGVSFDLETVGHMAEDEAVFRAERQAFRETIRDRVVTRLADEAFANATDDERLALVIEDYDPSQYNASEKAQLVDEHEVEIRSALTEQIDEESGDEIQAAVDERLAETRSTIRSNVTASLNETLGDLDPGLAEPVTDLALVAVDGYVADVTHDEFSAKFEAAADDLAVGVGDQLEAELDKQLPDRLDLDEELGPDERENLEEVRRIVGLIDLLAAALPLVGVVLAGLVYVVSRSVALTAIGTGLALSLGGLPLLVGAGSVRGRLQTLLAGAELPAGLDALVIAIAGRVADAVFLQSAAVVALGIVVLMAGLALHFDVVRLPSVADEA